MYFLYPFEANKHNFKENAELNPLDYYIYRRT